jgi:F420-non-reducing hydrogenase iron-sulfur subunit
MTGMADSPLVNQVAKHDPVADFSPEITVFSCAYCGYMAADTAGSLRQSYPANVKIVRLPCTGKSDIQYLLDAFDGGADGVYVVACSLGNCHHERGNERARARVARARLIMKAIGLEPERLDIFYLSGSMGATFAHIARQMTERIRALGPSPLKPNRPAGGSQHAVRPTTARDR